MGSYFQLKYAIAIIVAFSIDALQFLLGVVIAAAFFHPATALAILGCVYTSTNNYAPCWVGGLVGGTVGAVASAVPLLGQALFAITDAMGAGLAAIVDFCLSMVGYGIIIPMLIFSGIVQPSNFFKSWRRGPFILAKIIPGIDMLPFFTGMVIMSIIETETLKQKENLSYIARVKLAGERAAANNQDASQRLYQENLNARYTQDQAIALRERMSQDVEGVVSDTPRARTPLVQNPRLSSVNDNEPLWATNNTAPPKATTSARQANSASLQLARKETRAA